MAKLDGIEPFLTLPTADPLVASFAVDGIEGDLKQLVTDIFEQELARRLFDANVLGAPHLGTFDLVRRNVNADGLVLLPNSTEEEATRYLYRAWRSRDNDGRGLHFLKTYLQMLFPNLCDVEQMVQSKYKPYPTDLYPASTHGGDSDKFLTSRIEITLDWMCEVTNFHKLMSVFRSVIPARLTPLFRIRLTILLLIEALFESNLLMQKFINMDSNPCGFKITNKNGIKWTMPLDKEFTKLGFEPFVVGRIIGQTTIKLPFYGSDFDLRVGGDWQLGEQIGGKLSPVPPKLDGSWCLGKKVFPKDYTPDFTPVIRHCKITSDLLLQKVMEGRVYRPRYLNELNLKLNGQWQVGGRIVSTAKIVANSELDNKPEISETFVEAVRLDYPFTPPKLGGFPQLGTWRKLDAHWQVGAIIERRPFGFQLRKPSVYPDTTADLISEIDTHVNGGKFRLPKLETLSGQYLTGFWQVGKASKDLPLNGSWKVGGTKWNTESETVLDSRAFIYALQDVEVVPVDHFNLSYPFKTRLSRSHKLNAWHKLNGNWTLGGSENLTPFGFTLRGLSVLADTSKSLEKHTLIDVIDKYETLEANKQLDGSWAVGEDLGGLKLNSAWKVGGRSQSVKTLTVLDSRSIIYAPQTITTVDTNHFQTSNNIKLARQHRLNAWHKLDSNWSLNSIDKPMSFGFSMRDAVIIGETHKEISKDSYGYANNGKFKLLSNDALIGQDLSDLWQRDFRLDGSWKVGATNWTIDALTVLDLRAFIYAPQTVSAIQANHFEVGYSRNTKLARTSKLNAWTRLTDLKIGGLSNHLGFGFSMQNHAIPVESEKLLVKNSYGYVNAGKFKLSSIPTLGGQDLSDLWQGLTLNGAWKVGACKWLCDAPITLQSYAITYAPQTVESSTAEHFTTGLTRLARTGKVNAWTKLNGLFGVQNRTPFGFAIRSDIVITDTEKRISKESNCYLTGADKFKISPITISELWDDNQLKLNGKWRIGASKWTAETETLAELKSIIYAPQTVSLSDANHFDIHYPQRSKLARLPKLNQWHQLNGSWQLNKAESSTPFGFSMRRDSIVVDTAKTITKHSPIDVIDRFLKISPKKLGDIWNTDRMPINGSWKVGGRKQAVDTLTVLDSHAFIYAPQTIELSTSDHFQTGVTRLSRSSKLNNWSTFDSLFDKQNKTPFGFEIRRDSIVVDTAKTITKHSSIDVIDKLIKLSPKKLSDLWQNGGYKLDSSWQLGGRNQSVDTLTTLDSHAFIYAPQTIESTTADHFQTGVTRLSRSNKLTAWSKFENLFNKDDKTPFGFEIRSDITAAETQKTLEKRVDIDLTGDYFKLNRKVIDGAWQVGTHQNWLKLDGGWSVGGRLAKVETDTLIESNHIAYAIQTVDVTESNHFEISYPNRTRLGKTVTLNSWRSLNGQWQVGSAEVKKPFGFSLHNNESIPADSESVAHLDKVIDVFDKYTTLSDDGGWDVGNSNNRHKLTINGGWKLGQRNQIVESSVLIDVKSAIDVTQSIDSSISINRGGTFRFIDAAGNLQNYTLYTTEKIEIIDSKIALNVKPYGDIFLGVGVIWREIIEDVEIVEDHDNVTAIEINGDFYAQFDFNSSDINGLFASVTYLALQ